MNLRPFHEPRTRALTLSASGILLALCFLWVWFGTSPEERVAENQQKFLQAVADKNWSKSKHFLAPNYTDRFRHTPVTIITDLRNIAQHFFVWDIRPQGTRVQIKSAGEATVIANLTLSGNGAGLTDLIIQEANRLPEPWVFSWKKTGVFPWSWQLETIDNASLRLDAYRSAASF